MYRNPLLKASSTRATTFYWVDNLCKQGVTLPLGFPEPGWVPSPPRVLLEHSRTAGSRIISDSMGAHCVPWLRGSLIHPFVWSVVTSFFPLT